MEEILEEEILEVIASKRPLPFGDVQQVYVLCGSIDNTLKCIDYSIKMGVDVFECARSGKY